MRFVLMSFNKIRKGSHVAFTFCLILLFGCSPETEPPPIRVSSSYWVGFEPFFIAEGKGFFPPGSVHLIETADALTLKQTMRGDTIDAIAVSLSRALNYVELGHDVSIVLVLDTSNGADKLMALPEIQSVQDLKGKKVGTEFETVNSYLLFRALQENGLSPNDIELVPITNERISEVFYDQNLAGASVYGRAVTSLSKSGAHSIFDSSKIKGEIIDVLLVRTRYLEEQPKRVSQLIEGWLKAIRYLKNRNKDKSAEPFLMETEDFLTDAPLISYISASENLDYLSNNGAGLMRVIGQRQKIKSLTGILNGNLYIPKIEDGPLKATLEKLGER